MSSETHLCLVSAQATPTLTPVLNPAVAPRRIILLVCPDMAARAHWLENEAERGLISPEVDARQIQERRLQDLIDRLTEEGLLSVQGKRLRFPDQGARFYVNGGWLEEDCFDLLRELRRDLPRIQELARSVEILSRDVLAVAVTPPCAVGLQIERGRDRTEVVPRPRQETSRGLSLRHVWDRDNLALALRRHHGNRRAVSWEARGQRAQPLPQAAAVRTELRPVRGVVPVGR